MRNARYAPWLEIADELEAFDGLIYGEGGPFSHVKEDLAQNPASCTAVAHWIRQKCEKGRWYWWDKSTMAGKTNWVVHSMYRLDAETGGRFEDTKSGRELLARLPLFEERIKQLAKS